jgi:hypothetical protein
MTMERVTESFETVYIVLEIGIIYTKPVFHRGRQRSLPLTCFFRHLSLLLHSSNSLYMFDGFGYTSSASAFNVPTAGAQAFLMDYT